MFLSPRNIFTSRLYLISILAILFNARAQDPGFLFPHHLGDIWEYIDVDMFSGAIQNTLQSRITLDSTDSLGNTHVIFQFITFQNRLNKPETYPRGEFIIDSSNNVYHHEAGGLPSFLIYKLNANLGEKWVMYEYEPGAYEMARCDKVGMEYFWGQWRQVKNFSYYFAWDTTDTIGLTRYYSTLAENVGMIYDGGTHDAGYILYLNGAVINGILYGETTYVSIFDDKIRQSIPDDFELYQNYPNPFNSSTTIKYSIPQISHVKMTIYNVLGEKIRTLLNSDINPGEYQLTWNGRDDAGRNVGSGIYFIIFYASSQIDSRDYKEVRKTIYLK